MPAAKAKRVLLVGWDAADWKAIDPLLAAGKMPTLQHVIDNGVRANLSTLHPVFSPMLWTSIATGKRPYKHGILGFSEPNPEGTGVQPITNLSRKTKAVWNILQQNGLTSNVVGWWPSHPAEPISGAMVSNQYQVAVGPPDQPWPVRPGTIHPRKLANELADLRFNPNELEPEMVTPFIPNFEEIDQEEDRRLASCAKIIAEITSIHNAATWLIENTEWDFTAVYYDGIDHFGHGFMKYHPPQQAHISDRDFELYSQVIEAGYVYHDLMLGRLMQLAGPDTMVILISDHGFHPDHLRPKALPAEGAGPANEHRDFGILAACGPGIEPGAPLTGCSLLDVTPTLLTAFGLPVGDDMDGRVLANLFSDQSTPASIPSWDAVPGDDGCHPAGTRLDPQDSREALKQLVELGYIEEPDADHEKAIDDTARELKFNLAHAYMDGGRHADAARILEPIVIEAPDQYRYAVQLALCYQALERPADMRRVVDDLFAQRQRDVIAARKELNELHDELYQRQETAGELKPPPDSAADDAKPMIDHSKLSEQEQHRWRNLTNKAQPQTQGLDYLAACTCIAEENGEQAVKHLQRVIPIMPTPEVFCQLGEAHLLSDNLDAADAAFDKALELQPEHPQAHCGQARVRLRQEHYEDAANAALNAVDMLHDFALAHFTLAEALHQFNMPADAATAARTALAVNPNYPEAHELLATLADQHGDAATATTHRQHAAELRAAAESDAEIDATAETETEPAVIAERLEQAGRIALTNLDQRPIPKRPIVTIVSGLPRSGTSMMMQMLAAGGLELLTDEVRSADADNPVGYLEHEVVKNTWRDSTWVGNAVDKGVKVIAQLLPALPDDYHYRVIFMNRDLDEIVASQRKMLERQGKAGADIDDAKLRSVFSQHLRRVHLALARRPNFERLVVNYRDAIDDPAATAKRVNSFLGDTLDPASMLQTVRPDLYRQRKT